MEITFNTGNYGLIVKGEFSPEQLEKALKGALRWIVQRDVATEVYKEVAGTPNKAGDGKTLPKGFERDSIAYSPDVAEKFGAAAEKALAKYGEFDVEVKEHVKGDSASPMVRATRFVDLLMEGDELGAAAQPMFGMLGYEGKFSDKDALIAFAHSKKLGA